MSERAAVFIDGGYFDKVLSSLGRVRPDYLRFSDKVCCGAERFRTYYYHCMPHQSNPPTEEERNRYAAMDHFVHSLRRLTRFEVCLGRLQHINGEYRQKGIDTLLSIDIVELAATGQIGKAILVSGDSDFVPAIKRAKAKGVIVELFYSPATYLHTELFEACDDRVELNSEFFADLIRPPGGPPGAPPPSHRP
jgi:uncharacterized LabA/DUF88 family protein